MKTPLLHLVAPALFTALAWLAVPAPAHAADGIGRLVAITQLKAQSANDEAQGADKQRELLQEKKKVRDAQQSVEAASPSSELSHAGAIVKDVEAIVAFESSARADGLDDAELAQLAALVAVAEQHVDGAVAELATAIADTKQQLEGTKVAAEQQQLAQRLKSLRSLRKAHRRTSAALRNIAKKAAPIAG